MGGFGFGFGVFELMFVSRGEIAQDVSEVEDGVMRAVDPVEFEGTRAGEG